MAQQDDDIEDDDVVYEEEGVSNWIPATVVTIAIAGFGVLAWYAYHSGSQSVKEEDLVVVEAENTPVKEKPADPGGMKFPNQDKTIFDTFANGSQTPPNVERVLPAPEEPMPKEMDTSETKTWINDKLKDGAAPAAGGQPEQVIVAEEKKPEAPQDAAHPNEVTLGVETAKTVAPADDNSIITHIAQPEQKAVEEKKPAPEKKKVAEKKPAEVKLSQKTESKTAQKSSGGKAKIQLGAYGSQDEAKAAWDKIQKKFPDLASKSVYFVKAELPKGTFYRLRASGMSESEAKSLCSKLSAKGQACMLVP